MMTASSRGREVSADSGGEPPTLVEVAVPLPVFHTFTYRVEGARRPVPGTRVLVPFRTGERVGWVVGPSDPAAVPTRSGIRPLLDVLETTPSATPEVLALARWMSDYYAAPLGLVLRSVLPSVLSDAGRDVLVRSEAPAPPAEQMPAAARRVLEAVEGAGGRGTVRGLRPAMGKGSPWPGIRWLTESGLLDHHAEPPREPTLRIRKVVRVLEPAPDLLGRETVFGRATRQRECFEWLESAGGDRELAQVTGEDGFSRGVVSGLEARGLVEVVEEEVLRDPFLGRDAPEPPPDLRPTPAQASAIGELVAAMDEKNPLPFLLHGITGSGKTLVYIELLREVVERRGRTAIVLVPEIALTPQTVHRFRAWFGDAVAVLHSGLSDGERYDEWRQLREGTKRIVVGARSALFAPLPDLGAIVVDEEHDGSYKQSESPRYQGRDLAVLRAVRSGAVCVLGSATPSLESWRNAREGKFRLLQLPERAGGGALPPVEVVDLRRLREGGGGDRSGGAGTAGSAVPAGSAAAAGSAGSTGSAGSAGSGSGGTILSPRLVEAVHTRIGRGEQVILLLNRRGYASFVQCRACGDVAECPNCSVSLTFHRGRRRLLCHHCRHEEPAPARCPRCGDTDLSWRGLGTEQVERAVSETFPTARLARMDVDTTGGKWAHAEILGRVGRGEVDILLGTQMIAKGLDFANVTLVGVVNADTGLHLPDFRASERTFQLLSQVAGRAGRGPLGGEVILQTSLPEHYSIQCALTHDYEGFARRELAEREHPTYPPHLRLVNVVLSSPEAELAASGAEKAVAWWRAHPVAGVELVGPAPCPIERLHGRWRWHFFLRGGGVTPMSRALRTFLEHGDLPSGDLRVAVDRDPVALL